MYVGDGDDDDDDDEDDNDDDEDAGWMYVGDAAIGLD